MTGHDYGHITQLRTKWKRVPPVPPTVNLGQAALRGRKLKDLLEEGLRLMLEAPRETHRHQSLAALRKGARGAVDSGVPDLARAE
jgi:hypothetical protein